MSAKALIDMTDAELSQYIYDLERLEETLIETIRASDNAETWAYYGRSSREQLPQTRQKIYDAKREWNSRRKPR